MIETTRLEKRFGDVRALAGMTFTAADGAVTTLLGANGSGKTTTLRTICGLIRADSGSARVDGVDVGKDRLRALAHLGVLHDDLGLYPRLTAREHVRFCARLHGLRGRALEAAVERIIGLLELSPIADRPTRGFSHGQRMKVALARALVHAPPNVILDEPTRGLDVFSVRLLRRVLKNLRAQGVCVLMSSHAMAEVAELSDRVAVMHEGRVCAAGTPAELMAAAGSDRLEQAFVTLIEAAHPVAGVAA